MNALGRRYWATFSDRSLMYFLAALLAVGSAAGLVVTNYSSPQLPIAAERIARGSPHLLPGNPSNAAADSDNFLMVKPYFALSYNASRGTPNWVQWRLQESDLGHAPRFSFYHDATLPVGFYRVTPGDYAGSGFDLGHLCSHADRTATADSSRATFVMTNVVPQAPNLNRKGWAALERHCHDLVSKQHRVLHIVAGPQGTTGIRLADGRITVPTKCWKVMCDAESGEQTAAIFPNDLSVGEGWERYKSTVADIEKLTGYRFFTRLAVKE